MRILLANASTWTACAYFVLGLVGALGLLGLVSPRRFSALATRRVAAGGGAAVADKSFALPTNSTVARLVGAVILAAVAAAGYLIARP